MFLTCNTCRIKKKYEDFVKASWCKNGIRKLCKQCNLEHARHYNIIHKERFYKLKDEYFLKNKKYIQKKRRERRKQRYHSDINFKLECLLRSRLKSAISGRRGALKELGCSVEELKLYLESKFQPGMTWKNHGKWHIDHIVPVSYFDLTNSDNVKKCFNYKNLQPLWAEDNLKKKNSLNYVRP